MEITNISGSIKIGDHVWLGKGVSVLKNTFIGSDAVVGMKSVVTENIPSSSLAVGNPAKVVRHGITWNRQHLNL